MSHFRRTLLSGGLPAYNVMPLVRGFCRDSGNQMPKQVRVIADKAYDSDPLRKRLRQHGIELICPHKKNRVRPRCKGQDASPAPVSSRESQ